MTTGSLVYNKQKTYRSIINVSLYFSFHWFFLCAVQGLYNLKFDPDIDEDSIPIAVPLNMSVISVTPGAAGGSGENYLRGPPGQDQNVTFVIGKSRRNFNWLEANWWSSGWL